VSKLSLVRSSLEGCNGIVGVKAVGERSNTGSQTMGFNKVYTISLVEYRHSQTSHGQRITHRMDQQ
jgi:hypothetical protein